MLSLCEKFAEENNIMFSTHPVPAKSKSKAMHVVGERCKNAPPPSPLVLCGKELPWVKRCEHLGHALTSDGSMSQDCREKRAAFIDDVVKMREMFGFAHPVERISAIEKHCTALHGSNLWRLDSPAAESLFSSWRTNIKLNWEVPRNCRAFFVDHVLAPHVWPLKASVLGRFHSFFLSLLMSDSLEIQVMANLAARDLRTSLGSNVRLLLDITGLDPWTTSVSTMKAALRDSLIADIPPPDSWRVNFLSKLLSERESAYFNYNEEYTEETTQLINSLVVN